MRIKKSQLKRIQQQIRKRRIELLAKPKERKLKPWPDPKVYRPLPWKVPRAALTAIPSEQILRLYAPKKDFTHKPPSMCIEPGHYVSQYALKAVATPRVVNLAKPKRLHKPPSPPPKTKRQLKREKELRKNLDEAMKRLARPPRTEVVKKPQPEEEEPQPPAEPQPSPSVIKEKEAAAKKPAAAGPIGTAATGRAGGKANVPQTTATPAQPSPAGPTAPAANPRGKRASLPLNKTAAPTAPAPDVKAAKQPANVATVKRK